MNYFSRRNIVADTVIKDIAAHNRPLFIPLTGIALGGVISQLFIRQVSVQLAGPLTRKYSVRFCQHPRQIQISFCLPNLNSKRQKLILTQYSL